MRRPVLLHGVAAYVIQHFHQLLFPAKAATDQYPLDNLKSEVHESCCHAEASKSPAPLAKTREGQGTRLLRIGKGWASPVETGSGRALPRLDNRQTWGNRPSRVQVPTLTSKSTTLG